MPCLKAKNSILCRMLGLMVNVSTAKVSKALLKVKHSFLCRMLGSDGLYMVDR